VLATIHLETMKRLTPAAVWQAVPCVGVRPFEVKL